MAVALTATSLSERFGTITIAGTGLSNATAYIVTVVTPNGHTAKIEATSDGSGVIAASFVPQTRGSYAIAVRPATEFNGTTTALGTATAAVA